MVSCPQRRELPAPFDCLGWIAACRPRIVPCQTLISSLRASTVTASFTSEKDRTGLLGKLDSASRALSVGKNADAVQKLTDFLNKVTTLKTQGKLLSADADLLAAGAQDAITCLNLSL